MTSIYLGSNLYEIHIGHQKVQLSGDEISEIISHFIKYPEDNIEVPEDEELTKEVDLLEQKLKQADDELNEADTIIADLEKRLDGNE